MRFACVDRHAHSKLPGRPLLSFQGITRRERGADRGAGLREYRERAVAFAPSLQKDAAGGRHCLLDQVGMAFDGVRHRSRRPFPQRRRAFDVGQQKRDDPRRQHSLARRALTRERQRLVVFGYGTVHCLQLRTRLQAEIAKCGPSALVGAQRVGLAPASIQREHQQNPAPLPQRLLVNHRLEAGDALAVMTDAELHLCEVLHDTTVELLEASRLRPPRWPILELGQRACAPKTDGC